VTVSDLLGRTAEVRAARTQHAVTGAPGSYRGAMTPALAPGSPTAPTLEEAMAADAVVDLTLLERLMRDLDRL
jgi:hypothetical protein